MNINTPSLVFNGKCCRIPKSSIDRLAKWKSRFDAEIKKITLTEEEKTVVKKVINAVNDIVKTKYLSRKTKQSFKTIKANLDKIIKKIPDEPEDVSDNETEDVDDGDEEELEEDKSVDEIESELDANVNVYSSLSENNPMKGISYDTKNKTYKVTVGDEVTTMKSLEEACKKIMKSKEEKRDAVAKNTVIKITDIKKFPLEYEEQNFIAYWYNGDFYFDIRHIVSSIGLGDRQQREKYSTYKPEITIISWHKNEFNGYLMRELVPEKTLYKIIINSNSDFSKSFKDHVAELLVEIRKENGLFKVTTSNKTFIIENKEPKTKQLENDNGMIPSQDMIIFNYDSAQNYEYVLNLIRMGSYINVAKYLNQSVIYSVILPLKNKGNRVIKKFGYTQDIIERLGSLESEYKCQVFLIGIKAVRTIADEKRLHESIKRRYPNLVANGTIYKKKKVELYYFNPVLTNFFSEFNSETCPEPNETETPTADQMTFIEHIRNQVIRFIDLTMKEYMMTNNSMVSYLTYKAKLDYDLEVLKENNKIKLVQEKAKARSEEQKNEIKLAEIQLEIAKLTS